MRVTRQLVQVLVSNTTFNAHEISLTTPLSLADDAAAIKTTDQAASSILALADDASVSKFLPVSSSLSLSDVAVGQGIHIVSLSSVLTLTDLAVDTTIIPLALSSSLTLSDLANGGKLYNVTASNALTLTDVASRAIGLLASSSISMSDAVDTNQKNVLASNALDLTDIALPGITNLTCSNALTLADQARLSDTFLESCSNAMSLAQSVAPGLLNLSASSILALVNSEVFGDLGVTWTKMASNALTLADEVTLGNSVFSRSLPAEIDIVQGVTKYLQLTDTVIVAGPISRSLSSPLGLADTVTLSGNRNFEITQTLGVSDTAQIVKEVAAASLLELTDVGEIRYYLSSNLALTDIVDAEGFKSASNLLALTDTVFVNGVYNRSAISTLTMDQSCAYLRIEEGTLCNYTPFVGAGAVGSPTPPSVIPPTLTYGRLTLLFPPDVPTETVTLRNPDVGNSDTLASDRINRVSRGGTLTVFADPKWPTQQTLQLAILALNDTQVTELLLFFKDTLGQQIRLNDWEGRSWLGIITTPDAAVTRNRDCSHSVSFEFEGEIV